jgi:branched-chain amino acid transport system substrate-binding protein
VDLAIEEVNSAGGIKGVKVKLAVGDSKFVPKDAASVASMFASDPSVLAVVGPVSTPECMASAPIYERGGVTMITPVATHPDVPKQGKYIFRTSTTQAVEGPYLADFAVKHLNAKRIAEIYVNTDWGNSARRFFVDGAKNLGAQVVIEESYNPGDVEFNAKLLKIKGLNPDLLAMSSLYTDGALILKQAKKLGLNVPAVGTFSMYHPEFIKLGGDSVEGVYVSTPFFSSNSDPMVADFVARFKVKYNEEPSTYAAHAYDTAKLILAAIQKAGADRKAIRDVLATTKGFKGATGTISFDSDRDRLPGGLVMLQIKNGKYTYVKQ